MFKFLIQVVIVAAIIAIGIGVLAGVRSFMTPTGYSVWHGNKVTIVKEKPVTLNDSEGVITNVTPIY